MSSHAFTQSVSAISKGFKEKKENNLDVSKKEDDDSNLNLEKNNISDELVKLNELFKSGVLTQEEFERAKKKLIEN